mmetsp:Transcript_8454/g.17445  ORF Transcript_8454/g.17445 Transcript_8454/m.17445 type:complete len:109 (-) Transcript_8454:331-657(-)
MGSSSPTNDPPTTTKGTDTQSQTTTTSTPPTASTTAATPLQIAMAAILLGTSAGLTLYTKKTSSMLQRMESMNQNAVRRRGPEKFGPKTKSEWEKMRNRWGKDDDEIV